MTALNVLAVTLDSEDLRFAIQNAIDAVSLGSLYALFALGIALIFGIMRMINFAHGELIMIGGYTLALLGAVPWPLVVTFNVVLVVLAALTLERVAFRPVRQASAATLLVTSFAVSYFLQNLATVVFGAFPKTTNFLPFLNGFYTVGELTIPKLNVATVIVTAVEVCLLGLFLARSRLGIEMRAAAEDFRTARILGVRANRVIAAAFALSGVLAATASILLVVGTGTVTPTMGTTPVLVAFVATVLGGVGSLRGAVLGGFLLGVLSVILQAYLPLELRYYRDAFAYGAVILMLLVRPQGLIVAPSVVTRV